MPDAITYERPYVYAKQREAIFSPKRYSLIEASTKSGKTVGCIIWLTEKALAGQRGQNFWWIAPSYNQARIAYTRLTNCITPGTFVANKTELTVTLVNGAVIAFKTGEMPDKLYGEDVYAAVVDEASRVREDAWTALRSTLTATGGPVRLIGNVRGRKNWFYRMARVAEEGLSLPDGHPTMHYARLTVEDAIEAGVFDREEAEDARSQLTESAYQELYMAVPSDDEGNPFGGEEAIAACEIERVLWDHAPVCWGWDLAKSVDWTVGVGLDENGQVCRFYRWQKVPWRETISQIVGHVGSLPTLVDGTGLGDPIVEELQRSTGERARNIQGFKFSASSKQQLMEALAVAVQSKAVGFPRNPVGIELRNFEYQYTRIGVRYAAMEGSHDDCVCALALAWKLYKKPPKPAWYREMLNWKAPADIPLFAR